jgi:sedoheptulokinase
MILGIDVGTSKIAAAVVDNGSVLGVESQAHSAVLETQEGWAEQSPRLIYECVVSVVQRLARNLREAIRAVGITGQMHGVLIVDESGEPQSSLITWQDQRCLQDPSFLPDVESKTGYRLNTGFGCATLAWLQAHHGFFPPKAVASTIYDWVGMKLTGAVRPIIDPTGAQSWGLFDIRKSQWDEHAQQVLNLWGNIFPMIKHSGSLSGTVVRESALRLGIPPGTPVAVGLGDTQASMMATIADPREEVSLTLGTGGQLSAIVETQAQAREPEGSKARYEIWPFPGERLAIVAASLCGGSAWAWLAQTIAVVLEELGMPRLEPDHIYSQMNKLGQVGTDLLNIVPHFEGERYDPHLRGEICGIDSSNFTLGNVARALARGIIENLRDMLPPATLASRSRVVGSGNALRKNVLLQEMAGRVLGRPLVLSEFKEEAAVGAAINAGGLLHQESSAL